MHGSDIGEERMGEYLVLFAGSFGSEGAVYDASVNFHFLAIQRVPNLTKSIARDAISADCILRTTLPKSEGRDLPPTNDLNLILLTPRHKLQIWIHRVQLDLVYQWS